MAQPNPQKPRILFIAPVEPWCRENGSSVITSDLLDALATSGAVELLMVFLRLPPGDTTAARARHANALNIGAEGLPRWMSIAKAVALGSSPLQERFDNADVTRRVLAVLDQRGFVPTVVHAEHLPVVPIGKAIAARHDCALVYRAHNIESQLWARRLSGKGAVQQWLVRRVEREEIRAVAAADLTLSISAVDQDWMLSRAPGANATCLPSAIDVSKYEATAATATPQRQLCFVGGLEWGPNEHGLRWFVDEVLPRLLAIDPAARLSVLARGAELRPWLTGNAAVTVLPSDASARPLFAASRASLAPLLQGGGVRIKILESIASGCPVVATKVGGEGLALEGLTCTDDPAQMAAACARHLAEAPTDARRQALQASVRRSHGADVIAGRLVELWASARRRRG